MAPRKRAAKRARKATAREGSSAAPQAKIEFDRHRFRCEEHQRHFQVIEDWVQLVEGEYAKFQAEVARKHWMQLTEPMAKYDPEVVMEIYTIA
ncbi:hypothetical protein GmHk_20G057105 [Glycine max]|nr:hypothetical protein GmHk_20G057105 [Glycine max]